ncbi:hypothetical protein EWM64_g9320 [Hericium alpestre]|uniref:Uncharacterized protein n=1 Tax=Hericium alpestre TaxID=135208 RepID=A0A4Y9ZJ16_9AGAM|nr:hypothetical protein EWM64_g9320 [Hericium alpestre]
MPIKTCSKSKVKHAHPSTDEDSPQVPKKKPRMSKSGPPSALSNPPVNTHAASSATAPRRSTQKAPTKLPTSISNPPTATAPRGRQALKKKAGARKSQAQRQAEREAKEAAEQQAAEQIASFEEAAVAVDADAAKDAARPRSRGNTTKVLRVVIERPASYLRTTEKAACVEQDVRGDGEGEDDAAGNSPDDMVIDEEVLDARKDSENVSQELPEQSSTKSELSGDEDNPVQVPTWMESQIVVRREEEEESGGEEAEGGEKAKKEADKSKAEFKEHLRLRQEQTSRLEKDIEEIS